MLPDRGRLRVPLSTLHGNSLGLSGGSKGEPSVGEEQQGRASSSSTGGAAPSRIPAAPASLGEAASRPSASTASRIPRAPSAASSGSARGSGSGRGSACSVAASAGGSPVDSTAAGGFNFHSNPTFDSTAEREPSLAELCSDSPAFSCRTESSRQDLTPGMLDQAVYTPATSMSIQDWLRSSTPGTVVARAAQVQQQLQGVLDPTAYLRTGAHMLSPEPGYGGGAVQTPQSLLPTPEAWRILQQMQPSPAAQQKGVFDIMNAYLRTGAQMLSPEPGCTGVEAIPAPAAMAAVVHKGAMPKPQPPPAAAAAADTPASVRSSSVSSCNEAASASLVQQQRSVAGGLSQQQQQQQSIVLAAPVHAHDELPELASVEAVSGQRHGPPSPILFNLDYDSPSSTAGPAKSESPVFSFGMGLFNAGQEAPEACPSPEIHRVTSDESVLQPNPFKAMLCHLRGPQYASPAPAALHRQASPESPLAAAAASPGPQVAATPELGKDSLTQWIDRRGLRQALNTPARHDLQILWAAMRDNQQTRSEVDTVRLENAALARELEHVQGSLKDLGLEYRAAVEAAEASHVHAEAEIVRAREAAKQMMELSNQIQHMFNLCEAEKMELVAELVAAQQRLAETEAAAAGLSGLERAELEHQIEDARGAVSAAQRAADQAEARANDACKELLSIKAELATTQQQLANALTPATPMGALKSKLQGVHDALAGLHHKQSSVAQSLASPSLDAKRAELQQLLVLSKQQLGAVQVLLGEEDEIAVLRGENQALKQQLQDAMAMLAAHTPASAKQHQRDFEMRMLFGSPTPLRLSTEFGMVSQASERPVSALSGVSSGAGASPFSDLLSSSLVSQATLTVDYRDLHGAVLADSAASGGFSPLPSASGNLEISGDNDCVELGSPTVQQSYGAERGYTVVHNGLIVTNVPASEVSKVKSMVEYWEAVACGHVVPADLMQLSSEAGCAGVESAAETDEAPTPMSAPTQPEAAMTPAVGAHEPAAEAHEQQPARSTAAAAAGDAAMAEGGNDLLSPVYSAMAAGEVAVAEGDDDLPSPIASTAAPAEPEQPVSPMQPAAMLSPVAVAGHAEASVTTLDLTPLRVPDRRPELESHPLSTPFSISSASWTPASASSSCAASSAAYPSHAALPEGITATPATLSADRTPSARFTPLNFLAADGPPAPHPTPIDAADAARAQSTPSSGINLTPLSLSALRKGGSSDMQAAVRSRLQRLKMDLQKAQAKLQTVDQGLAAIAVSPASSMAQSLASTPIGGKSPSTPTTEQRGTSFREAGSESASPTSKAAATAAPAVAAAAPPETAAASQAQAPPPSSSPKRAAAAPAAAVAEVQQAADAEAGTENVDASMQATPAERKVVVRFAEGLVSSSKPSLRASTPGTALLTSNASASPAVGSSSPGWRTGPGSAARRPGPSPLQQSAVKAAPAPLRAAALDSDNESSSSDFSDDENVFDNSQIGAQAGAATPKAAKATAAQRQVAAAATPKSSAYSSTSSFSPPEPLAFMAMMPLHRLRRAPAGLAGGRRRPSETEEREFRRRAAALKIQISPYFKRR